MRQGLTLPMMDSLIAATAIVHELVVVTRNVADLKRLAQDDANLIRSLSKANVHTLHR
ncbi:hypothetical protein [Kyrpidia sp.]|uniref:hypothetical protein n=1 Tax=Kyrpidia sp. TaxID=2073077 RepID=UPI00258F09E8|nr:hypothetical protein [Kyrpidia sp.]MCL6577716.1 hypothetical protein [Kyrpidia sp.]